MRWHGITASYSRHHATITREKEFDGISSFHVWTILGQLMHVVKHNWVGGWGPLESLKDTMNMEMDLVKIGWMNSLYVR